MLSEVEARLHELGEVLPVAKSPVANYLGCKRSGDVLYVSGRVSEIQGEVGTEVDLETAYLASKQTVLMLLAIVKEAIGDLDQIASVEQMQGFVRSATTFTENGRKASCFSYGEYVTPLIYLPPKRLIRAKRSPSFSTNHSSLDNSVYACAK